MDDIIISTDTIKKDFDSILDVKDNSKIFFSGKFGIGKTYFLKDFFISLTEKYDVFHLYPVNYQISHNEDILELIKYDLLIELFKKNKDILHGNDVNGIKESALLFYSWCKKRFSVNSVLQSTISIAESSTELLADPFFNILARLGKPMKDLLEIDKEFREFKKDYKNGEKGQVEIYVEAIRRKNISETDYISDLLKRKIVQQKGTRKSVLILDDMDRIDPDHVFRILNILSAYFEEEHENKFGFDKVIVVADYNNLKHIFHHKYGAGTDYSGYIDKFFSISPYYFDNKRAVMDRVEEIVKSIKNEEPKLNSAIGDSGYIKLFLWHVFSKAVDSGKMNLRSLLKVTKFQLIELRKGGYYEDHFEDSFQKIFDIAIKVSVQSFSNVATFIEILEVIKDSKSKKEKRMPYGRYIVSMLKSFDVSIPENPNSNVYWRTYKISKDLTGMDFIKVDEGHVEHLFYDLLIEYINEEKYIKDNYHNYEN